MMVSHREVPKSEDIIEVFTTESKGFGVRATDKIEKGVFIIEYVGEVKDHSKANSSIFREKLREWVRKQHVRIFFIFCSCLFMSILTCPRKKFNLSLIGQNKDT